MKKIQLTGLVAATHTPFDPAGELNLAAVESQAAHLQQNGVQWAFIGGSTGESHSLSLVERTDLTERWTQVAPSFGISVIVHVGANCLKDARQLAGHAQQCGAEAFAALAPMYFKPRNLEDLIASCAEVASGAPDLPFYFYDIPALTGVNFPMSEFLSKAPASIPNLNGIKFTNPDLMAYQTCLQTGYDLPWGVDEYLLAALALGAKGGVGSSYNFAAPIYLRLIDAFKDGDMQTARTEQYRSVQLIRLLASFGYMAAAKATMKMLGVDVGPPRLPNARMDEGQIRELESGLQNLGFFEWAK